MLRNVSMEEAEPSIHTFADEVVYNSKGQTLLISVPAIAGYIRLSMLGQSYNGFALWLLRVVGIPLDLWP